MKQLHDRPPAGLDYVVTDLATAAWHEASLRLGSNQQPSASECVEAWTTLSPRFPKWLSSKPLRFHHFFTTLQPNADFVHLWGD
jgi:hypothetical protein